MRGSRILVVAAVIVAALASDRSSAHAEAMTRLTVDVQGRGTVFVWSAWADATRECTSTCTVRFPRNQSVSLYANPGIGSREWKRSDLWRSAFVALLPPVNHRKLVAEVEAGHVWPGCTNGHPYEEAFCVVDPEGKRAVTIDAIFWRASRLSVSMTGKGLINGRLQPAVHMWHPNGHRPPSQRIGRQRIKCPGGRCTVQRATVQWPDHESRLIATPLPGWVFERWKGCVPPDARVVHSDCEILRQKPGTTLALRAVFERTCELPQFPGDVSGVFSRATSHRSATAASCNLQVVIADTGTYDMTDAINGQVQEHVALHWNATDTLTFPRSTRKIQVKPTIDVGGTVAFNGPDPSESYTCNVTAVPAAHNTWTAGLVELGAQGGTYGVQGYPESDPLTIITGQTDPVPDVPGGSITLSGASQCRLENSPTFLAQSVNTDSHSDWLAAKTPFQTSGKDLKNHRNELVKSYPVDDTLPNGNETKHIVLSRTITVTAAN